MLKAIFRTKTVTSVVAGLAVMTFAMPAFSQQNDEMIEKIRGALARVKPTQPGIDCDTPTGDELNGCRMVGSEDKKVATISDASGRVIRKFYDRDGKNGIDQWSYYKNGIEVYRDTDTDLNRFVDEHRWMGPAGMRWAVDKDENEKIDGWKMISAAEVGEEVFLAIQSADAERFGRVLISRNELQALGLGPRLTEQIEKIRTDAATGFASFARDQPVVNQNSEWSMFGTDRPTMVPAGNAGMTRDVVIYDHPYASVTNGGKYVQISLGTMARVGDNWRVLTLPQFMQDGRAVDNGGLFYPMPGVVDPVPPPDDEFAKALDEREKLLAAAKKGGLSDAQNIELEKRLAQVHLKLADLSEDMEGRVNWLQNYGDGLIDGAESGRYPGGLNQLNDFLDKTDNKKEGLDYLRWRVLNVNYSQIVSDATDSDARNKASEAFIATLEQFVNDFEKSKHAAEAMNNIAVHYEVLEYDDPKTAVQWYRRLATEFPEDNYGKKARGAYNRLTSKGKVIEFEGTTIDGKPFDLSAETYRGKIIVIHYWEEYSDTAKDELEEVSRIFEKYKKDGVVVLGANLDEPEVLKQFLRSNSNVNWPQLNAPGGVDDSPLAHQLGPLTVPMIVLINKEGGMVDSDMNIEDLDRALQNLTRD